jgi:sugar phosphate permease
VFPLIVVVMIAALGWRQTWISFGAALALVLVPAVLWLLRGHGARQRALVERTATQTSQPAAGQRQWSRDEVLRDVRFHLVIPTVVAPSFLMTGVLFHQVHLVETKGWDLAWWASSFVAYGAIYLVVGLFAGPLCDRAGATRLLPFYVLPMALGMVALALFDHAAIALVFLALCALTSGVSRTVVGAMWAETYGVAHLGAIRALVSAIQVFGTAVSPVGMGWMLDAGITMDAIAGMCAVYIAVATALTMIRMRC